MAARVSSFRDRENANVLPSLPSHAPLRQLNQLRTLRKRPLTFHCGQMHLVLALGNETEKCKQAHVTLRFTCSQHALQKARSQKSQACTPPFECMPVSGLASARRSIGGNSWNDSVVQPAEARTLSHDQWIPSLPPLLPLWRRAMDHRMRRWRVFYLVTSFVAACACIMNTRIARTLSRRWAAHMRTAGRCTHAAAGQSMRAVSTLTLLLDKHDRMTCVWACVRQCVWRQTQNRKSVGSGTGRLVAISTMICIQMR